MAEPSVAPEAAPMDAGEENKEESGRPAEDAPEKEQETRDDSDEGGEEDEDKKPAAKKLGEKSAGEVSDNDDNNNDSASSNSSREDDEGEGGSESKSEAYVTEDGRTLSEYEIQRLERIKRNRAYLAQLGLAGKDGGGVLGKKKKKERPRKAPTEDKPVIRRVSRRSKAKPVTYTEPSASVRDLLRVADKKATNAPVDLKLTSPEKADMGTQEAEPPKQPQPNNKPKKRSVNDRQEQFVYLEFLSIQSSKNQSLRQAERNVRTAEKEVKYWHKLVQRWERRKQRQSEAQRQRQTEVRERAELGGNSIKEVLQEIDSRMPEIAEIVKRYDDLLQAETREQAKDFQRLEAEEKFKVLDAIDRFPKAMKNAVGLLNAMFLERAPKDPPPPRRSKRSAADDEEAESAPPKKKASSGAAQQSSSPSTNDEDIRLHEAQPKLDLENNEGEAADTNGKSSKVKLRKRVVRNVGGWVSPEFAAEMDRSWLASDTPPDRFDLSKYVPQAGDTVLYYVSGHKQYLSEYPDVLAKKAKIKTRVPLWERAAQLKEEDSASDASQRWWTDNWLDGVESFGLGDYPVLCRVERTHVEFPPDPFSKVVKKDDASGATKVYFKKPKNAVRDTAASQLRLAVTLRPLTPLEPPAPWEETSPSDSSASLALPPLFSVSTFPCKLDPFLVPFGWAYARAHSLSVNQKVLIRPGGDDTKVRIDDFASLAHSGTFRLEEKAALIRKVLDYFDSVPSKNAALEKELAKHNPGDISLRDAHVVLDVWSRNMKGERTPEEGASSETLRFMELIRSTLPLWKSVKVMRNMYDRTKNSFSPWQLVLPGSERELSSPWSLGEHSYQLDEALRVKIECLVEDIVAENTSAAELFFDPVTEEIAPSYFCAVPIGMSLSNIAQRLESKGRKCYYRSVDAVISDVTSIVDACLLYNNPEAEVVCEAANLVALMKQRIAKVIHEHYQEIKDARRIDDQRRLLVLQRSKPAGSGASLKSSAIVLTTLRKPFKEPLYRDWLEQVRPECAERSSPSTVCSAGDDTTAPFSAFCPQVGDCVLYSRELHDRFVKGHYPSLEADQCVLPNLESIHGALSAVEQQSSAGSRSPDEWAKGTVVWARPAFPKVPSKQSKEDANTFCTMSTLLALGIQFRNNADMCVIHWRPCLFQFDNAPTKSVCPGCSLSARESFLRLESERPLAIGDSNAGVDNQTVTGALSPSSRQSIDLCINLLKKRCLKDIPPSFTDPQLTKESVRAGYKTPLTKVGKGSLPVFDELFCSSSTSAANPTPPGISNHGTRGVSVKPPKENPSVESLKDAGFLPVWASKLAGGSVDDAMLQQAGTILPSPKLCLELIQLRLRNDYYRHEAALENDLAEAYLCTVFMMLSGAATRKRSPVSVRRVARSLSSKKENFVDNANIDAKLKDEETDWVQRIRNVRELYSAALVSVSDTIHTERVFGLVAPLQANPVQEAQDPNSDRAAARQKITYILRSIYRDECLNAFGDAQEWGLPMMKLTIKCNGEPLSFDSKTHSVSVSPLQAQLAVGTGAEKLLNVKLVCGGQPVSFGNVSLVENQKAQARSKKERAPNIYFGPDVYERNDTLSRLFFGRLGRTDACARCQAYKRSMMVCRVARRHSNLDFDWFSSMPGGISHIDDLLKTLRTLEGESAGADRGERAEESENGVVPTGEKEIDEEDLANGKGVNEASNANDVDEHDAEGANKEEQGGNNDAGVTLQVGDPREFSNKAEMALQLAKEVLVEIKHFAEAPVRLSKEFIEEAFPVDEDDGHYLYCIICGRSGNLLCCDGCPNVVHPECVGLADLPDGDWFCQECDTKKTAQAPSGEGNEGAAQQTKQDVLPFGRVECDFDRLDHVTTILDELRSSRPTQKKKKGKKDGIQGDDDDEEEEDDDDDAVEAVENERGNRRKRPVEEDDSEEVEEDEQPSRKRQRRKGKEADDPFEILSATTLDFLRSIGITTADDFLSVRTADLASKLVRWRRQEGMSKLKGSGPSASVSAWKTAVHNKMQEMGLGSEESEPEEEDADEETEAEDGSDEDPLEVLSDTTLKFLRSIGIKTAAQFLSMRTTDISPDFVTWRAAEGMAELKGTGPIASVSAWKTSVRNKAKQMGLDEIVELKPDNKAAQTPTPRKKRAKRKPEEKERRADTKRSRRKHADRDASSESDSEEEAEESKIFSVDRPTNRGMQRRSVPPPRFADIYQKAPELIAASPPRRRRGKPAGGRKVKSPPRSASSGRRTEKSGQAVESFVEDVEVVKVRKR